MKKITPLILLLALVYTPLSAAAQLGNMPFGDVSLAEVETIELLNSEVTILTTVINNGATAQDNLSYVIDLYRGDSLIDTYTHPNSVSLMAGEERVESITYIPPGNLNGSYQLVVGVLTGDGYPVAFAPVDNAWEIRPYIEGDQNELNNQSRLVSILSEDCALTKEIESGEIVDYSLLEQVPLGAEEQLNITCSLVNNTSETIVAYPNTEVFAGDVSGETVVPNTTDYSYELTAEAGITQEFSFPVMVSRELGNFLTVLSFVNEAGEQVSNDIRIETASYGVQADILSLTLDQDYYQANSEVGVSFTVVLRNNPLDDETLVDPEEGSVEPQVELMLTSGATGELCTEDLITSIDSEFQSLTLESAIDCINPKLAIRVFDDTGELATATIQRTSTDIILTSEGFKLSRLQIAGGAVIVFLVSVLGWLVRRRRLKNLANDDLPDVKTPFILFMLVSLVTFGFLGSANYVSAASTIINKHAVTYDVSIIDGNRYVVTSANKVNGNENRSAVDYLASVEVVDNDGVTVVNSDLDPLSGNILSVPLPSLEPGEYTFLIKFTFAEEDETVDFEYVVEAPSQPEESVTSLPDLVSTYVNGPSEVMAGESFNVSANLRNNSWVEVDGINFVNTFSFEFQGSNTLISEHPRDSLKKWKTVSDSTQDLVLTTPGTYILRYCVDSEAVINETNETNNCNEQSLTVVEPAPPVVTLSATRDFIRPGELTMLSWKTDNTDNCFLSADNGKIDDFISVSKSDKNRISNDGEQIRLSTQHTGVRTKSLEQSVRFNLTCESPLQAFAPVTRSMFIRVDKIANPPIVNSCNGFDLSIVIDESGSIDAGESSQLRNGLIEFVESINTDTLFSFSTFSTNASVQRSFSMTKEQAVSYLRSSSGNGYGATNWERGLIAADSAFDPRPDKQNVILFASDGLPNMYGSPPRNSSQNTAISYAVSAGNRIKDEGTAIYVIGIGDALANGQMKNLEAISGPGAVVTSGFANVGEVLTDLSTGFFCGDFDLCINPVPNAQLLSLDEITGIQEPVEWNYSLSNTANSCEFVCNTGYVWDSGTESCLEAASGNLQINGSDSPLPIESLTSVKLTWDSEDVTDPASCDVVSLQDGETILSSGLANNSIGLETERLSGGADGTEYTFLFRCDDTVIDVTTIEVEPGSPDLISSVSSDVSTGFNAVTGYRDYLLINYAIKNLGDVVVPSFVNYITLDAGLDGLIDRSKIDDTHTREGMAAENAETPMTSVEMTIDGGIPPGNHRVCVTADFNGSAGSVDEEVENNNSTCVLTNTLYPDPGISITTEPSGFVRPGSMIDINWSINGAGYIQECIMQGPTLPSGGLAVYQNNAGDDSGVVASVGPINNQSKYLFECTATDLATKFTTSVSIKTVGRFQEI